MMSFNPENNIDKFIQECVLDDHPINSLTVLKEHKKRFESLKEMYHNLNMGRGKLKELEEKTQDYELKLREYQIRELLLLYQEWQVKLSEKEENERVVEVIEAKLGELSQSHESATKEYDSALERYKIAANNDILRGMNDTKKELQMQLHMLEDQEKTNLKYIKKLESLQLNLKTLFYWFDQENREYSSLLHILESKVGIKEKIDCFIRLKKNVEKTKTSLNSNSVHIDDEIKEANHQIEEMESKIKKLSSNIISFPKYIEDARNLIQSELQSKGINTEVRLFAELVKSIKHEEWRLAIETFLGKKRYYLIVDGKYCSETMEIAHKHGLRNINVVITDKLPNSDVQFGSAASELDIPNVYARRFANYLLNGIHLCNSLEELHDNPKGGLMTDGTLAKSYSMSCMDIAKTEVCLGMDAIALQLKRAKEEKKTLEDKVPQKINLLNTVNGKIADIERIDFDVNNYHFNATELLCDIKEKQKKIKEDIHDIDNNPDMMEVLNEEKRATENLNLAKNKQSSIVSQMELMKQDRERKEERNKNLSGEIYSAKNKYDENVYKQLEIKRPMLELYEKLKQQKGSPDVMAAKTVANWRLDVDASMRQMESIQLEYCKLDGQDLNRRGAAFIAYYRQAYKDVANVKIEETHKQLEVQAKKLESAFMNDFVAELNEAILEAKEEIDLINKELAQIPFGNDTYKFKMIERNDRKAFFSISEKLKDFMNQPELYLNSNRDNEEMEQDIKEFLDLILEEEDEDEYTDYRKYFVYDMEIRSRQGTEQVVASLSKKQGSASNGEKQTPYFIILAASLLQCYPRNNCCARLAFIDEAFSALSRERIEQMVNFLEDNNFQVIYAAPPEKIGSIGAYINSTVSMVITGRYTNVVEGLVNTDEFETK
jgi:chromosome segregation ATPase